MSDLAAALIDPARQSFTRQEVATLIGVATRWGYETRVDEENGAYPPPPVLTFGQWSDQADARREWDAGVHLPRPTDNEVR